MTGRNFTAWADSARCQPLMLWTTQWDAMNQMFQFWSIWKANDSILNEISWTFLNSTVLLEVAIKKLIWILHKMIRNNNKHLSWAKMMSRVCVCVSISFTGVKPVAQWPSDLIPRDFKKDGEAAGVSMCSWTVKKSWNEKKKITTVLHAMQR